MNLFPTRNFGMLCMVAVTFGAFGTALGTTPVILAYGVEGSALPVDRTWNGAAWSTATSMLNISQKPRWTVLKCCPIRNEMIAAFSGDSDDINAMVHNGTSWGNMIEPATDLGTYSDRPFYLEYEQLSGDGLLCFRQTGDDRLYFRTWNGTNWSSSNSTVVISTNKLKFVKMAAKPNSNEILVAVLGSDRDLIGLVWNGSAFTNITQVESNCAFTGEECFDVSYERITGRAMLTWAQNGSDQPRYRIWTGSSWTSSSSAPSIGSQARWLRLASDPVSNKIIMLTLDDSDDVNANVWSGSAWGTNQQFATDSPAYDRRNMDVVFARNGTNALAAYGRSGQTTLRYRTYNGSTWSAEQTGPSIGQVPGVVQLLPSGGQEIFTGFLEASASRLHFARWNGTGFVDNQILDSDVAGDQKVECFMLVANDYKPRIAAWREVRP